MLSGATLDILQNKQLLDDFVEAKRAVIYGIMGDRYINQGTCSAVSSNNRNIWYIDAINLYGCAMMQKLPYKDFIYNTTSLDTVLNTLDDSDHGYYIVCDYNYTNSCKDRTRQLALMPNKRKTNDNELGYRERETGRARTEK